MPIVRQHSKLSDIAKLAELAGRQIAARKDYEQREAMRVRAMELRSQQQLEQARRDQQFQLAQMDIAADSQKQQMAFAWENQKLLLNSQFDFQMQKMREQALIERELREELRERDRYDITAKRLKDKLTDGSLPPEQYNQAILQLDMKFGGAYAMPSQRQPDTMQALLAQALTGGEGVAPGGGTQTAPTVQEAINPTTGERIISYDNGATWQPTAATKPVIGKSQYTTPEDISRTMEQIQYRGATASPVYLLHALYELRKLYKNLPPDVKVKLEQMEKEKKEREKAEREAASKVNWGTVFSTGFESGRTR